MDITTFSLSDNSDVNENLIQSHSQDFTKYHDNPVFHNTKSDSDSVEEEEDIIELRHFGGQASKRILGSVTYSRIFGDEK